MTARPDTTDTIYELLVGCYGGDDDVHTGLDISPFLTFRYVVGHCQGQSFSVFNSPSELALCHGVFIFGLKVVIFYGFWQPNAEQ